MTIEPKEILKSITQHKLRNALTGFGIAWGIFIMMLMMGFGDSFQKGIFKVFSGYAENTIMVYGGSTSLPYQGQPANTEIKFENNLIAKIKTQFEEVEYASLESNNYSSQSITYDDNFSQGSLIGVDRDYFQIKKLKLVDGRLFNSRDIELEKPVCILTENMQKILFKGKTKIIGENINIGGNFFQVIGISKAGNMFEGGDRNSIIIPISYHQMLFNLRTSNSLMLSLNKDASSENFNKQLNNFLARTIGYDSKDAKALYTFSLSDQVKEFQTLFSGITIFIWFVGFCIMLTGVISVGNIMYVNINERTREIGIRKAIGATPRNILEMILAESVVLTSIAGAFGMLAGYIVIKLIQYAISMLAGDNMFLANVGINPMVVLTTFLILVGAGVLAGFLPARKASKIKPVIALSQEN